MMPPGRWRRGGWLATATHDATYAAIQRAVAAEAARQATAAAALRAQYARCQASQERATALRAWAEAQWLRDADPGPDLHHPTLWWVLGGMVVGAVFTGLALW